jgi:hypothetical protein
MKNLFISLLIFITIGISSCKKSFPDDPLAVDNYTVSDCKTNSGNSTADDAEFITIKTVDDYYLLFNHINSVFNCEPGEITVAIEIRADTISINENETMGSANCVCPYDLEFRLGPMHYGKYITVFRKGGLEFKTYSLDFRKSTDVQIDL